MPVANKHIDQARRNIDHLAGFYKSHLFNDWTVTVSFYSCVHIVEAAVSLKQNLKFLTTDVRLQDSNELFYLVDRITVPEGIRSAVKQSSPHDIRDMIVKENFGVIADDYHVLWKWSSDARYKCWVFKDAEADWAVKSILIKTIEWFNKEFKQDIKIPADLKD